MDAAVPATPRSQETARTRRARPTTAARCLKLQTTYNHRSAIAAQCKARAQGRSGTVRQAVHALVSSAHLIPRDLQLLRRDAVPLVRSGHARLSGQPRVRAAAGQAHRRGRQLERVAARAGHAHRHARRRAAAFLRRRRRRRRAAARSADRPRARRRDRPKRGGITRRGSRRQPVCARICASC